MTKDSKPAKRPGMGALPGSNGVAFRVWAPNAEQVYVVGDFNDWSADATPLASEGNGNWSVGGQPKAEPGQEYKFRIVNGDQDLMRIDPYARQVTNSVGNGVIYDHAAFDWAGDDPQCPPHNELVIYELHVGSFVDNEGRPATLEEVEGRFRHLRKLGVNCLQLMPMMEFAGDYSWGYNPAHIFAVESAYGGPDGLKAFVKAAHEFGFAVIVDVVYNHFGPSDLDLWRFDGWSENDKGGIYFYNDERSATPWGDTRPDYGRPQVRDFIRDNALMWLRDYHVDGLRYDMTPYMRSITGGGWEIPEGWDLCHWVNTSIREEFPGRITIAEDLHQEPRVTDPSPSGAAFHAQWDSAFVHPVRRAITERFDENRSVAAVLDAVTRIYGGDAFARVIYTESHDEVANGKARVPSEVDADDPNGYFAQKRSTLGAALTLASPGIPMLFAGQEFLQGEWFRDDVPLDWDQNKEFHGIVRLYRDLIALRRNVDGRTRGLTGHHVDVLHADDQDKTLAFVRWADGGAGDDTVVVVNMSAEPREFSVPFPREGGWSLRFNSDARIYSDAFGDHESYDTDGPVSIGPYSALVYSQD